MSKHLSNCPFCGSPDVMSDEMANPNGKGVRGFVECLYDDCCAIMYAKTEEEAIRRWELRRGEQILKEKMADMLEKAVKGFEKYETEIAKFIHKINILTGSK